MLKNRLARLAKAARDLGGGVCRLCYGHPVAGIQIMWEDDPDGPGLRKTGECYLLDHEDRITDDLRCARCGTPAAQVHLMCLVDIGPKPDCRLIRLAERAD